MMGIAALAVAILNTALILVFGLYGPRIRSWWRTRHVPQGDIVMRKEEEELKLYGPFSVPEFAQPELKPFVPSGRQQILTCSSCDNRIEPGQNYYEIPTVLDGKPHELLAVCATCSVSEMKGTP